MSRYPIADPDDGGPVVLDRNEPPLHFKRIPPERLRNPSEKTYWAASEGYVYRIVQYGRGGPWFPAERWAQDDTWYPCLDFGPGPTDGEGYGVRTLKEAKKCCQLHHEDSQ